MVRGFDLLGGGIKNVITGIGSLSTGVSTITVNISEIDMSKSIVIISLFGGTDVPAYNSARAKIISNTSIQITRFSGASGTLGFAYQVIEFSSIKSLQRGTSAISDGVGGATITAVNMAKSILIFSHSYDNTSHTASRTKNLRGRLYSSTGISFDMDYNTGVGTVEWQVVEFN